MQTALKWLLYSVLSITGLLVVLFIFYGYPFLKDIAESMQPCKDTTVYITVTDALAHKDTACHVFLYNQGLTEIPPELFQLSHLRVLRMPYNAFSSFPEEVTKLYTLRQLDLSGNNLGSISPSIGNLKKLRVLNLNKTNIADLPKEIGELSKLEAIHLSGNRLTQEPEALKNRTRRIAIDYTNNPFWVRDVPTNPGY